MELSFLIIMDILGTIAFAVSGAMVAIRKKMDIFGIMILAITTSVGGGLFRDIIIGQTPPVMFQNPLYVLVAAATALVVICILYFHKKHFKGTIVRIYDLCLFWFDTLGLAAFTVDGVLIGIHLEDEATLFLEVVLGVITGVGGGLARDIMAQEMPAIFVKHIYACASLIGAFLTAVCWDIMPNHIAMLIGFCSVILIRFLAMHFNLNLPKVHPKE